MFYSEKEIWWTEQICTIYKHKNKSTLGVEHVLYTWMTIIFIPKRSKQ